jgi:hypothetical protein
MDIYYKIYGVRSISSTGTECYNERMFLVEKTYEEYVNASQLIDNFQAYSREHFDSIWWIDPARKKLFLEIGGRIREDDFPEWYLKACSVSEEMATWDLKCIDDYADVVRVDTFKQFAVNYVMAGQT